MSEVADRFCDTVRAGLDAERQALLDSAARIGEDRELRRIVHLADRAVRQWAAQAAAHCRAGHPSAYEHLDPLRPELGAAVKRAAVLEQKTMPDAKREEIAQMVWGIGERLAGIDTRAPSVSTQHALNQMAVEAGEILLCAGRVLAKPDWVVEEANETLRELAGVR